MADNEPENTYTDWPESFPETTYLVPYIKLRHSDDPEIRELYDRAKNHEDQEAAAELINRLVTDEAVEKIKAAAARNPQAVVVSVHAVEGSGKNAIPPGLAVFIGMHGNLEVDNNIVQTSIVAHTGQSTWYRLAHRAVFEGDVKTGREYMLVDDVFSAGGTLSELRHFIEINGGHVVDTITMANGAKSFNAQLSVTGQHILELERKFGIESLQRFLKEEQLYGGNHKALTDAEARTLLGAKSLDEARDQIAAARQEGIYRILPEMVQGTSPDAEEITDSPEYQTLLSKSTKAAEIIGKMTYKQIGSDEFHAQYKIVNDFEYAYYANGVNWENLGDKDIVRYYANIRQLHFDQTIPDVLKNSIDFIPDMYAYSPILYNKLTEHRTYKDGWYVDDEFYESVNALFETESGTELAEAKKKAMGLAENPKHIFELDSTAHSIPASYEAEQHIPKEKKMSDEYNEAEGFEEEPVPEEEAAFTPDEAAEREPSEASEKPEPLSPDEQAFRNALKMRTQIAVSLQNGSLPCLPGADGLADTQPAVNLTTGTRYHGANLLYLKDFQKRNGFPTAEYATADAIQKSGVPLRRGEKGIDISFSEQNKQTGEWENKNARLFNVAQTAKPWEFRAYAEKLTQEKEQEKQTFLKNQYGDAYQPREKAEQKPGPEISCTSTEPERYLGQYLAAVSLGGAFKATPQQASEFAQKMKDQLYKPMATESEYPDPFKLSKICREANVQCKEIIKEIKQPQHKQEQTQQHKQSRHL